MVHVMDFQGCSSPRDDGGYLWSRCFRALNLPGAVGIIAPRVSTGLLWVRSPEVERLGNGPGPF